jgi:hypothetical protein
MYYIVKKGEGLDKYIETWELLGRAKQKADMLKSLLGHNYDVIKVEVVWTTQTLYEAMKG